MVKLFLLTQNFSSSSSSISSKEPLLHMSVLPSIVWLAGERSESFSALAPDLLRLFSLRFPSESPQVKCQILDAAVKMSVAMPDNDNVQSLMMYVVELARYEMDTDVRDRSRFMTAMMGMMPTTASAEDSNVVINGTAAAGAVVDEVALEELTSHARDVFLPEKFFALPIGKCLSPESLALQHLLIGSLSAQIDHMAPGYRALPSWAPSNSSPAVRNSDDPLSRPDVTSDSKTWSRGASSVGTARSGVHSTDADLRQFYENSSGRNGDGYSTASSDEEDLSSSSSEASDAIESEEDSSSSSSESSVEISKRPSRGRVPSRGVAPPAVSKPLSRLATVPSSTSSLDLLTASSMSPAIASFNNSTFLAVPPIQSPLSGGLLGVSEDNRILAQLMESFPKRELAQSQPLLQRPQAPVLPPTVVPTIVAKAVNVELLSYPPKVIVRSEVSSGLLVTLQYRHGVQSSLLGGTPLLFTFENKRTNAPLR